jgi:hypothetical protein
LKYTVIKNNSLNILYYNTKLKFKNSWENEHVPVLVLDKFTFYLDAVAHWKRLYYKPTLLGKKFYIKNKSSQD